MVPQQVKVKAQDLSLVCPGSIFRGKAGANLGSFSQYQSAYVYYSFASSPSISAEWGKQGSSPEQLIETSGRRESQKSVAISVHDSDASSISGSRLLNSTQLQKLDSTWAAGLLGASCQRPGSDFWLLGGDTRTGRETLLILVNSSDVDSTVDLELLAGNGYVSAPGLSSISVPKHATTVVPVNGLAPDLETFAVHVTSRGGPIASWLQHRAVRGTQAAGVDFVMPSAAASKTSVIPGILIRGSEGIAEITKRREDFSDTLNFVRVANTNSKSANVLVSVIGSNSKTFGTVVQSQVAGNSVADIPLGQLADGDYSIFISSDQTVSASAKLNRFDRSQKPITDFAWLPAMLPESGERVISVPTAGITKLVIANPNKATAAVELTGAGAAGSYKIQAGGMKTIMVTGGPFRISSTDGLAATLIVDVNSTIAGLPLVEYRNLGNSVQVAIR